MGISIWISVSAVFIALLSLFFAIWVYRTHDKKLKTQQRQINDFNLKKLKKEEEEKKKAIIEANVIKDDGGKRIIKVYNKGKAVAKDVNIIFPKMEGVFVMGNPSLIDIIPQHSVEIILMLTESSPEKLTIILEWKDNYSDKNKVEQTIQIG